MNFLAYENGITIPEALNVSLTGIVVVMLILALLAVLVVLLSKGIRAFVKNDNKQATDNVPQPPVAEVKVAESKPVVNGVALPDNQSSGNLDLYKTDEKTAAVIMAIVSNESGIPLNKLQFNSIKLIEE